MERSRGDGSLQTHETYDPKRKVSSPSPFPPLRPSFSRLVQLTRCPGNLYKTFPFSTSQIVTVLSPPPTATLLPPSSKLQAALESVDSNPAGAPVRTRCSRVGETEKGLTSQTRTVESKEEERRWCEEGEMAREAIWRVVER